MPLLTCGKHVWEKGTNPDPEKQQTVCPKCKQPGTPWDPTPRTKEDILSRLAAIIGCDVKALKEALK